MIFIQAPRFQIRIGISLNDYNIPKILLVNNLDEKHVFKKGLSKDQEHMGDMEGIANWKN